MCKLTLGNFYDNLKDKLNTDLFNTNNYNEEIVHRVLEDTCDPYLDYGIWLRYLDLFPRGRRLVVMEKDIIGYCENDCTTLSFASQFILKYNEVYLIYLLFDQQLDKWAFIDTACNDKTQMHQEMCPSKKMSKKYSKERKKIDEAWQDNIDLHLKLTTPIHSTNKDEL